MSNTTSLRGMLYCAIRNRGYTTKDGTDEVVEAVLEVLVQQTLAPAVPDDKTLVDLVYKHFYTEKDQSCLLHDVGPYEITEPRPALRDFARALLQSAEVRHD